MQGLIDTDNPPKAVAQTFNTLGQVAHNPEADLLKKAKRKAITVFLSGKLIELNNHNIQAYRNMYYCNSILSQNDQELKTAYCKNRLCAVCNAIKTANLINGYVPELMKFENPLFLTLTIKAVQGRFLKSAINGMQKTMREINKHLSKYDKIKVKAIRKLECNYNLKADTYNPHFHFVIDGLQAASYMLKYWLEHNPRSDEQAQDIRIADYDSMTELFKYATKVISKDGAVHPKQLDIIYTAFRNKRIVQPVGIKKVVDEDEREKVIYADLEPGHALWQWDTANFDWINQETGEYLTNFLPDKDLKLLLCQLNE